jgi:Flp pilus assembly protein TadG
MATQQLTITQHVTVTRQVMVSQPRRQRKDDRGSATLELAILGPAQILLTFTFVQAGLYYHASSLVAAAAREGATAAASHNAPADAGPSRARAFLTAHAGDSVTHPQVSTDGTTATLVRIQVSGTALSILPGIPGPTVRHTAQAPRERLTTG